MLTAEDLAYLRQAAARDGYNPDHALKVFSYESSTDPTRWGGKGGGYFGLFQAGAPERAQFGVDTVHPSARNQIDAFGKFLHARGYRAGMPLMDMYSTVLAGSPGHYNRSDGAGTVAEHVARMNGEHVPGAGEEAPVAPIGPPPDAGGYGVYSLYDNEDAAPEVATAGSGDSSEVETQDPRGRDIEEDYAPGLETAFSAQQRPVQQIMSRAANARRTPELSPLSQVFNIGAIGRQSA